VVGEINIGCGQCALCKSGLSKHCRQRRVLGIKNHHGAFAEFVSLPVANLHVIPDHVPDEKAVFAEPVAAAARILEQVNIDPNNNVLVIGAGRLGLLIAQVVNTFQCQLRVVVRHDKQRQILKQFGISAIDDHQLPNSEADIVIEASGSPSGLQSAIKAVKPTGTIVLKSTHAGETSFNFARIVVDEINIIGSRCGSFEAALKLFEDNQIDPTPLISHQFSLSQALQAFEAASRPGSVKVILRP
jgi:2-desacetyl-2-hydroxyethyl bacteriochlorophyllide A dehydrogenase